MLDQNWDFRNLLGANLLDDKQKEIFSKPPNNDKDYRAYRTHYEDVMSTAMKAQGFQDGEGFIKCSAICDGKDAKGNFVRLSRQKKEHFGCNFVFSCHHVIHCDPVNPEPVHFIPFKRDEPFGYFLCHTCFKLMERCKLDIYETCCTKCVMCVAEQVTILMERDPGKFKDYRFIK